MGLSRDPGETEPAVGERNDWRKFWADHSNCGGTWVYIDDPSCPRVVCSCGVAQSFRNAADEQSKSVVHIAGLDIQVGAQLRQRCGWCGAILADYDLDRIAVPEGQDPRPGTWPVGALIEVDGPASWVRPHTDGEQLPPNACAQIDHEVTGTRRETGDADG